MKERFWMLKGFFWDSPHNKAIDNALFYVGIGMFLIYLGLWAFDIAK